MLDAIIFVIVWFLLGFLAAGIYILADEENDPKTINKIVVVLLGFASFLTVFSLIVIEIIISIFSPDDEPDI